ncbi:dipeptidase [Microlunatus sp. Y2014]|uniref:dipeptidase n=1 Tax=Microlunatus sp. Y2014 TaxID=3418488 RepID=UPI003DA6EE33
MSGSVIGVVDGHNDLPWRMRQVDYDLSRRDVSRPQSELHTDLPRARQGGLVGQFWSVFVPCNLRGADAVTATLQQVDFVHELVAAHPEDLRLVTSASGLQECLDGDVGGPIACLMGAEGGHSIDDSLGVLRNLYRLGVRYLTLTHNENTAWADSATDEPRHGGLTDFGRTVVTELNRLGMMVDLSHTSPDTMRDAMDTSRAPVIFSHSSCRAVCDHPRNVPDDVLGRLATDGGLVMITFVPQFVSPPVAEWELDLAERCRAAGVDPHDTAGYDRVAAEAPPRPQARLADVVAHCEHAREVAGIRHIGIGGDYDGVSTTPVELPDVASYPRLLAALADLGWSRADLTSFAHGNLIRVMHEVERVGARLRATTVPAWQPIPRS